jgi:hypothetical protein
VDAPHVVGEVRRSGEAVLLPLGHRLEADALQLGRDVADELPRGLRLVVAHLPQQLQQVGRIERHAAGEQLVEYHA